jgi:hypothetical protein
MSTVEKISWSHSDGSPCSGPTLGCRNKDEVVLGPGFVHMRRRKSPGPIQCPAFPEAVPPLSRQPGPFPFRTSVFQQTYPKDP